LIDYLVLYIAADKRQDSTPEIKMRSEGKHKAFKKMTSNNRAGINRNKKPSNTIPLG
jgi:hypothetical protein